MNSSSLDNSEDTQRLINHALITIRFSADQVERLSQALQPARITVVTDNNASLIEEALKTADVAFIKGKVKSIHLEAPELRWIHCNNSGLEKSATPEFFARDILLTGSAGRSAAALSEHAMMFMLALNFGYPALYKAQAGKQWEMAQKIVRRRSPLAGSTLGIIGVGHTGRALALRARAMDMRVLGFRRKQEDAPEGFDHVYSRERGDSLETMLQDLDYLVLAASLNNETKGIINDDQLAVMKEKAIIVNLGRGALINEAALLKALDAGTIAAAGLDTFATEPLCDSSPLWTHPKLLITAHSRPTEMAGRRNRVIRILIDNIQRYNLGQPLCNQISERDVYSIEKSHDSSELAPATNAKGKKVRSSKSIGKIKKLLGIKPKRDKRC